MQAVGTIFAKIGTKVFPKPSVAYYGPFPFPNADTIVNMLPFLLFAILLITAMFATYISYQKILFYPSTESDQPLSWALPA